MNFIETVKDGIEYSIDTDNKMAIVTKVAKTLTSVCIPTFISTYPVRNVGYAALRDNHSVKEIYLPDTVWGVRESAFENCSNLERVHFYDTTSEISTYNRQVHFGHFTFQHCEKLECVTFDNETVINLGNRTFNKCNRLVKIGAPIHRMQHFSLNDCEALENLILDNDTNWEYDTFRGCRKLKNFIFLGDIHSSVSNTALKRLKGKTITCPANSKLVDLAFEGAKVIIR